jgi:hypothetical protein
MIFHLLVGMILFHLDKGLRFFTGIRGQTDGTETAWAAQGVS